MEATPSKSTAHLTKLISRQKARRKIRPQPKKVYLSIFYIFQENIIMLSKYTVYCFTKLIDQYKKRKRIQRLSNLCILQCTCCIKFLKTIILCLF